MKNIGTFNVMKSSAPIIGLLIHFVGKWGPIEHISLSKTKVQESCCHYGRLLCYQLVEKISTVSLIEIL